MISDLTREGRGSMIPRHVDCGYVARHLWRISTEYRDNHGMQADSQYRIASHVFDAEFPLTESDKARLKEFIADFYASPKGSKALADKSNRW